MYDLRWFRSQLKHDSHLLHRVVDNRFICDILQIWNSHKLPTSATRTNFNAYIASKPTSTPARMLHSSDLFFRYFEWASTSEQKQRFVNSCMQARAPRKWLIGFANGHRMKVSSSIRHQICQISEKANFLDSYTPLSKWRYAQPSGNW